MRDCRQILKRRLIQNSWTHWQAAGGLLWTLKLQKDLVWSDGQPLKAGDYVIAIQRAATTGYDFARYWGYAGGIKNLGRVTEGSNVAFEICDLRDVEALKAAFANLQEKPGAATTLVNNAARDDRHAWQDVSPAYWDERFATNLRHMFFAMQAVAPGMITAGGGSIINLSSDSWWEAVGGFPAYATAKAAVHGLTRTMARDLGQHRIRVNTVVPGWIMTERQKTLWATPEALEAHRRNQCLPDLIEPAFVARMVLFLASDDAMMCTANNYMVEAGSI
jgi:D-xylose 1-dehydrogenase